MFNKCLYDKVPYQFFDGGNIEIWHYAILIVSSSIINTGGLRCCLLNISVKCIYQY